MVLRADSLSGSNAYKRYRVNPPVSQQMENPKKQEEPTSISPQFQCIPAPPGTFALTRQDGHTWLSPLIAMTVTMDRDGATWVTPVGSLCMALGDPDEEESFVVFGEDEGPDGRTWQETYRAGVYKNAGLRMVDWPSRKKSASGSETGSSRVCSCPSCP